MQGKTLQPDRENASTADAVYASARSAAQRVHCISHNVDHDSMLSFGIDAEQEVNEAQSAGAVWGSPVLSPGKQVSTAARRTSLVAR